MKKWNAGKADEAWKIIACARDVRLAEATLEHLAYILTDMGHAAHDKMAEALSEMSGKEIAEGLIDYRNAAIQSIRNGLNRGEPQ